MKYKKWFKRKYSKRQWKCYDRCLAGLKKWKKQGKRVKFLTLTLPACNCCYLPVQRDLDGEVKLEKDIDGIHKVVQDCWRLLYKRMKLEFGDFEYFGVRTGEGNGVFHAVIQYDEKIPYEWLQENWVEIAGTNFVWIVDPYRSKHGKVRDEYDMTHYLMSQYVGFDQPDFVYGYSSGWVYKGFTKDYDSLKKRCKDYNKPYQGWNGEIYYSTDYKGFYEKWDMVLDERLLEEENSVSGFSRFMDNLKRFQSNEYRYMEVY